MIPVVFSLAMGKVANGAAAKAKAGGTTRTWQWSQVLVWLVVWKACFLLLAMASMDALPRWESGEYPGHRHWPVKGEPSLESRFATWDAAHYLFLAQGGYQKRDLSSAFYPLWPALIRGGSYLCGHNVFLAAMILAQVLSILGVLAFHRLVFELHDVGIANLATLFLLSFPGAIFFSLPYTESLFLLLASLFLLFLLRGQMWKASAVGFFLPLTKAIGIFAIAPMAYEWWSKRKPASQALSFYGPILGYGAYFALMYFLTGNALEGFEAQRFYPHKPSIGNMVNVSGIYHSFVNVGSFHDSMNSALDRVFFLIFLVSLPFIWRLNKTLFFYAIFAGGVPALSTWFFSYSRNVMMCLPLFIVLAIHLQGANRRWWRWSLLTGLFGLQVFFLTRYLNFMWAG